MVAQECSERSDEQAERERLTRELLGTEEMQWISSAPPRWGRVISPGE